MRSAPSTFVARARLAAFGASAAASLEDKEERQAEEGDQENIFHSEAPRGIDQSVWRCNA